MYQSLKETRWKLLIFWVALVGMVSDSCLIKSRGFHFSSRSSDMRPACESPRFDPKLDVYGWTKEIYSSSMKRRVINLLGLAICCDWVFHLGRKQPERHTVETVNPSKNDSRETISKRDTVKTVNLLGCLVWSLEHLWFDQIEESHNPAVKQTSLVLIRIMAPLGLTPNFDDYGQTE